MTRNPILTMNDESENQLKNIVRSFRSQVQIESFGGNIREFLSKGGKSVRIYFFFFFFFSLNFYSGYIKAKGSIEKYTGGMQGIRENYRYYYYYDFVLNNHKCGREKNDIYLFNFAFDTGTSAPIIDLLDSRI